MRTPLPNTPDTQPTPADLKRTTSGPRSQLGSRRLKILHVLASLDRGGAETWLMDVMRRLPKGSLQLDACVLKPHRGKYEAEFESLGGNVYRCPLGRNPLSFMRRLRLLLESRRYDIIHSHLYYFSGAVLRAAAKAGVAGRIAHNHPVEDLRQGRPGRKLYAWWMKRWMISYGTHFVGPTRASLESMWGPNWQQQSGKSVIYNGVNVDRFRQTVDVAKVRESLQIPNEAKVILNVARFASHKRQRFLVDVARHVLARSKNTYFVLVGAGPMREEVMQLVASYGLQSSFRFIEGLPSIDHLWLSADAFAFPSINEGFGIVVAEAGAAGLPVVACDIPGLREAAVACSHIELLPTDKEAPDWSDAILRAIEHHRPTDAERAELLQDFPFSIERSAASLLRLYQESARECTA